MDWHQVPASTPHLQFSRLHRVCVGAVFGLCEPSFVSCDFIFLLLLLAIFLMNDRLADRAAAPFAAVQAEALPRPDNRADTSCSLLRGNAVAVRASTGGHAFSGTAPPPVKE